MEFPEFEKMLQDSIEIRSRKIRLSEHPRSPQSKLAFYRQHPTIEQK